MSVKNYRLHFKPEICRECRSCELACSLVHESVCSPELSRIHVAVHLLAKEAEIHMCRHCEPAPCLGACPVGAAMSVSAKTGAVVVHPSHCTICGECIKACPYNNGGNVLFLHPEKSTAVKCNLCSGNPQCVDVCPNGALTYSDKPRGG